MVTHFEIIKLNFHLSHVMLRFLKHKASFIPIKKKKNVQGSFDCFNVYDRIFVKKSDDNFLQFKIGRFYR